MCFFCLQIHYSRWLSCPYIVKTLQKIFFSRAAEGIWTEFGMKHVGTMMIIFYVFGKVWITNAPAIAYRLCQKL